uniref:Major facilitator superfamily associated domain-containing protein n=1 Tax=Lotharella globosa TaxID=91324 RepID=A0A7S3ZB33_9EUKA
MTKVGKLLRALDGPAIEAMIVAIPMGMAAGAMNALLFVYLKEMGATTVLLGTTLVCNIMTEIPCFIYSRALRERFGIRSILYIGLLAYAARVACYAVITNPWTVLPAELLHGQGRHT